ncbi:hypothetical protein KSC_084290 [Ktedonobacter sp. SOSP1-52]|uniref:hypothetical protein n=1 Tax=Ktedonobacter sp. SOSP1-52 TaxID=2778366 RepID=UPI001A1BFF49|nr:hypothetical protein [Ktedonobacter sp. SOSP1-52]GHO69537.1 hypothetical protein KSC_084290 [Ktedonobacter sp. SOSP1-52]
MEKVLFALARQPTFEKDVSGGGLALPAHHQTHLSPERRRREYSLDEQRAIL